MTSIYDQVDKILWDNWDPLDVNENTNLRDEYSCYVSEIASMVDSAESADRIKNALELIESTRIGLSEISGRALKAANLLACLRN